MSVIKSIVNDSVLGSAVKRAAIKSIAWMGWDPGQQGFQFVGRSQSSIDNLNYASQIGNPLYTPLIMGACKWMERNVHMAPMYFTERDEQGILKSRSLKHHVLKILKRPNEYYSGRTMMKSVGVSWMLSGNAYLIKLRDGDGTIRQLWWEPHFTIRPRWPGDMIADSPNVVPEPSATGDGSKFISFYEVYRGFKYGWQKIRTDDIIHFKDGMDPSNPRLGINGLASLLAEIYTDTQRAHFSATVLSNLGMIPFVISPRDPGRTINAKQAEKVKNDLEIRTKSDRGKPIVAGSAIRVDELGIRPGEMALSEMAMIPQDRVASVIGPNAYVLGFKDAKFSNMVEARRDAYEGYLIPTCDYFAEELTSEILEEFEVDPEGKALEYDFFDVPAMIDFKAKLFEIWGKSFRDGISTRKSALDGTSQPSKDEDDVYIESLGAFPTSLGTGTDKFGSGPPSQQGALGQPGLDAGRLPPRDQQVNNNERPSAKQDKGPNLGGKK